MKNTILLILLLTILTCCVQDPVDIQSIDHVKTNRQQQVNINPNWQYLGKKVAFKELDNTPDDQWESLDLPHTWNALDAADNEPGYRRTTSWYKKLIHIPKYEGAIHLYFEGVNISSSVYVNGQKAGGHIGGYVGFEVNISDYVKLGQVNEIFVGVDNSVNPDIIPSQNSDFVIYGGITRDVWLKFYPKISVRTLHISTPEVSKELASTKVQVQINSKQKLPAKVKIAAQLIDPQGNKLSSRSINANVESGISLSTIEFTDLPEPRLWSPDSPELYTVKVSLASGKINDEMSERFGYRWYEFEEHGPFYLNGERLLLRGTHRHEEWVGLGNALPDSLHRRDMEMIKEMGVNFVRLAHYPHDPEVYQACDELGLLVWDEFPRACDSLGSKYWQSNTERLFKEQISQNFNHPSIIIWSFGGSLDQQANVEDGKNTDSLPTYISRLYDIAYDYDPNRSTSLQTFDDWVNGKGSKQEN